VVWIASAKLGFPDRAIVAFSLGADLINIAREAMLSIGCIQAQRCHTGNCPAGVTTHGAYLQPGGLDSKLQSTRFARYCQSFPQRAPRRDPTPAGYEHPMPVHGRRRRGQRWARHFQRRSGELYTATRRKRSWTGIRV